jgi:F-type H+-transporting ATPase subunit delta
MRNTKVAHRYAKSLLDLATERGEIELVEVDMVNLMNMARDSRDLRAMLSSPVIPSDKKEKVLNALFGDHQSQLGIAFMRILASKGREAYLPEIAAHYLELMKQRKGILIAEVRTATPLTDELRAQIKVIIGKMKKGDAEITEVVDPAVIGGYILKVEDIMVDASVSTQLRKLRREFTDNPYEVKI